MKSTVYRSLLAAAILGGLATHAPAINTSIPRIGRTPTSLSATRVPSAAGVVLLPGAMPAVPSLGAAAAVSGAVQSANTASASPLATVQTMAAGIQSQPANSQSIMAQAFDGMSQKEAPAASYDTPSWSEQRKIDEARRLIAQGSPIAASLDQEFRNRGGQIWIDRNSGAAYHAAAFRDRYGRPTIALTADTVDNGSWAFIAGMLTDKQTNFSAWYNVVPASAERLAIETAHLAMSFAEATNGSATAWSTNLDHNHLGEGTYYVWSWYEQLLKAATGASFIESDFFAWLRDFTSKQISSNPSYQYSLYERFTGQHYRPGTPEHETPIPAHIPRLNTNDHQAASEKIYGSDGNGDNGANTNLLGFIRGWFSRRGNI